MFSTSLYLLKMHTHDSEAKLDRAKIKYTDVEVGVYYIIIH